MTTAALDRTARAASRALPGFGLTIGVTVAYLSLLVLLPLAGLFAKASTLPAAEIWHAVANPRAASAFAVSFGGAALAAAVNLPVGLLLAWVLTRYRFPGRRLLDGLIDLPFALPTAVAGIALTTLYAPTGWIGGLVEPWAITIAYTRLGIVVALVFVGLPFVVRSVQPVLQGLDRAVEEAALTLGARAGQSFRRVILPALLPAALTGSALAFARGLGEYGSVIFIAGNRPGVSEILPLLIVTKLEQFDYPGAAALACAMLLLSFLLLLAINLLQGRLQVRSRRHAG
jgi:sulfate transport system permease protein